jgi:hypothetical protein
MQGLRAGLLADELDSVLIPAVESIPGCEQGTVYRERWPSSGRPSTTPSARTLDRSGSTHSPTISSSPYQTNADSRRSPRGCSLMAATLFSGIPERPPATACSRSWSRLGLGTALCPSRNHGLHPARARVAAPGPPRADRLPSPHGAPAHARTPSSHVLSTRSPAPARDRVYGDSARSRRSLTA